jgi:hypothetical protein
MGMAHAGSFHCDGEACGVVGGGGCCGAWKLTVMAERSNFSLGRSGPSEKSISIRCQFLEVSIYALGLIMPENDLAIQMERVIVLK